MLKGSAIEEKIWNYFKDKGLNDFGIAGLMGNLYAESALNPKNLQNTFEKKLGYTDETYTQVVDNGNYKNFVNDGAGYGLAQWTYWSRKQSLQAFAKSRSSSIGDLETQLNYLDFELGTGYKTVLNTLKNAKSIKVDTKIENIRMISLLQYFNFKIVGKINLLRDGVLDKVRIALELVL